MEKAFLKELIEFLIDRGTLLISAENGLVFNTSIAIQKHISDDCAQYLTNYIEKIKLEKAIEDYETKLSDHQTYLTNSKSRLATINDNLSKLRKIYE